MQVFGHRWLKYVFRFGGPIALIASIWLYYEFSYLETHGGSFRTHVLIVWLYETLGLWGTVGTFLVVSAIYFFFSIKHFILKKQGKVVNGLNPGGTPNMWC